MPTPQVRIWSVIAGFGVRDWAAGTIGIWLEKGGLTTQWKDSQVRKRVWEIAQSMSISKKQGAGPKQWDLQIDRCLTRINNLVSTRPYWKWYMADKTIPDGQKLKAALDECAEVGNRQKKNKIDQTPTKKRKLVHVGMYFVALLFLLLFLMMCRSRRLRGRNLGSPVFADKCPLLHLDRFPCPAISLYHCLCGSRHRWEDGG